MSPAPGEDTALVTPTTDNANSSHKFPLSIKTSKLKTPGHKTSLFLDFIRQLSLRTVFRLIGEAIGTYPLAFLIASVILCSSSFGMVFLHLRDNVRDGFTPSTSMARYETDVYKQFLNSSGDPSLTSVLFHARDGGSMHRLDHLRHAVKMMEYIKNNLTATLDGEVIRYSQFCGSYCRANDVISYFYSALSNLSFLPLSFHSPNIRLTYPIAIMGGYEVHLERNFYSVKTTEGNYTLTNIEHLELILASFMGEMKTELDSRRMAAWEIEVFKYTQSQTEGPVEILVIGSEICDVEMNRDAQRMAPYFAVGFISMFCFVCSTVYFSALYFDKLTWHTVVVALASTIVPIMAITSTLGIISLFGMRTNQLLLIMPFLIMGIGVNDSFLTVHAWLRQPSDKIAIRLGRVFEEVGPSITTTTLTNVITFLIGALTPTQEISLFCFGTAIALGFAYIYTLILFGPILYFSSTENPKPSKLQDEGWRKKLNEFLETLITWYARIISNRYVAVFLFSTTLVYWYFAILGTLQIESRLDTEKILPAETPIKIPNKMIEELVWTEYYPVTVIINTPFNISNEQQRNDVMKLHNDFESMQNNRGKSFTLSWLRAYTEYFFGIAQDVFDYYDGEQENEQTISYSKLNGFLDAPLQTHFKSFVQVDRHNNGSDVSVNKFSLIFVYQNTSSWDDRIQLVLQWREIVSRYPSLNATIWSVNSMFVDQMLSLKTLALQSGLWTLVCMVIVCALFIQNPISVALASLAIASISLGVTGYLSFWHLDLDPVTLGAVLMSIGMSVDFTAHTTYHYQLRSHSSLRGGKLVTIPLRDPNDKLRHTVESIAWPMTQAALSTVICILPLVLLQNYIPLVFVKTISLVVIWGMWHGLVLLPACLAQIPSHILDINCYRNLFRSTSSAPFSGQEMSLLSVDSPSTSHQTA